MKKEIRILIYYCIGAAVVAALFLALLVVLNSNRIVRGVRVAGINIGGMSEQTAKELLKARFEIFNAAPITIEYASQKISVLPTQLGINLDNAGSVEKAAGVGHDGIAASRLKNQVISLFTGWNAEPSRIIDKTKIKNTIAASFGQFETEPIDASIYYSTNTDDFVLNHSKTGILINYKKLNQDLAVRINDLSSGKIELALEKAQPDILDENAAEAISKARIILKNLPHFIYANSEKNWLLEKETMIKWIKFEKTKNNLGQRTLAVEFDRNLIRGYLGRQAIKTNQQSINARLTYDKNENAIIAAPSQEGIKLAIEPNIEKIIESLKSGRGQTRLELEKDEPKIKKENLAELGLLHLLGRGATRFDGSPLNRNTNIRVSSARYDGVLLAPGEEFSFGDRLGEVGPEQGYKTATVIKGGKKVQEYGGGICQVSTTVFRAAVWSGLEITQRLPHGIPIATYAPHGFDATVYPPYPDLKFVNNTPNHVFIQSKIVGTELIFEFYGNKDGKKVKLIGPTEYDKKEDGSLKAVLRREILKDSEVIKNDVWYSSYKSPQTAEEVNPLQ